MWSSDWRDRIWAELPNPWDVIVIGGGVTGAGIFLESVRAGLRTLLVEANDFAYGTSSRSSKLIHGGLRYLKNKQFSVTYHSVNQRERLLKEAPFLVQTLPFCFPHYRMSESLSSEIGLAIYDLMGKKWQHTYHNKKQILDKVGCLNANSLMGGHLYSEAVMDDARFVLRLVREGCRLGGFAVNYCRVVELLNKRNKFVAGVRVDDVSSGIGSRTQEVYAPIVINATGPWTDDLRHQAGGEKRIRKLRGSHLVFPNTRFPIEYAITLSHPIDHRMLFAIPWLNCTLLGTTDLDHPAEYENLKPEPFITQEEFDYLLQAARHAFPKFNLQLEDVISTFSGLRPIVNLGSVSPSKASRAHTIIEDNGLFTITGGKFTTYRLMAMDILKRISPYLEQITSFNLKSPVFTPVSMPTSIPENLSPDQISTIIGRYGFEAGQFIQESEQEEQSALGESTFTYADLRWAARREGVIHLDDLLLRRTRLGITRPNEWIKNMQTIREICQQELGWDDIRWTDEVLSYTKLWNECYAPPQACLNS